MDCQSRFNAGYRMLGAVALGWPRGMVWAGRWEGCLGLGTRVHPWWIHVDIWQNQYNIVKFKDGGGVGRGVHFLPHKFIKRAFKHQVNSTKQLLKASRGHQAPRKATQVFERIFLIYAFWYLISILYLYFLYNFCDIVCFCFFVRFLSLFFFFFLTLYFWNSKVYSRFLTFAF